MGIYLKDIFPKVSSRVEGSIVTEVAIFMKGILNKIENRITHV
jgi:hypothetical protein